MKQEEISFNTKKKLSAILKEEMKHKPFEKITVSELIEKCEINRKTFYYHFNDIYDLLRWTFEQETVEAIKNYDLFKDSAEVINFVLDYCEENRYLIISAYDSIGRDGLKRFFYNDFYDLGLAIIEEAEKIAGKKIDEKYKKFLCSFYTEAISGILFNQVKKETKMYTRKEVVEYISLTIKSSLKGVMEEY